VDLIGSAETNVTVSLDPSENLLDSDVVAALAADLAKVCRVKVIAPCAAVTLVGRGMRSMLYRLSGVLAEFGRERVHLISQSSNNLNLTFVVDEGMLDGLLPRLHELLVRAGAMRTDDSSLFGPSSIFVRHGCDARACAVVAGRTPALAGTGAVDAALRVSPANHPRTRGGAARAALDRPRVLRRQGQSESGDHARDRASGDRFRMRVAG
jgi:hypothetical protein